LRSGSMHPCTIRLHPPRALNNKVVPQHTSYFKRNCLWSRSGVFHCLLLLFVLGHHVRTQRIWWSIFFRSCCRNHPRALPCIAHLRVSRRHRHMGVNTMVWIRKGEQRYSGKHRMSIPVHQGADHCSYRHWGPPDCCDARASPPERDS
jgi:hypothetical protein